MYNSFYIYGRQQALERVGLEKHSAATNNDESGISTGQGVAMGAAAAAPFAGLIGQKPLIHDPHLSNVGERYKTVDDLARAAQSGDVLVTTKPNFSMWKQTMTPLTGTDFYHAQPVIGRRGGQGVSASAGEFHDPSYKGAPLKNIVADSDKIPGMATDYSDYVLLRPKDVNKQEIKQIAQNSGKRLTREYDMFNAMRAWAHDLFVPKIPGVENLKGNTVCEGNVCSTLPAQALKEVTGKDVVPGKPAKFVMPADFLRSDKYDLIGAHLPNKGPSTFNRKILPYASRAALGAGLAAGTYATTENPEVAAVPAGMVAGNYLGPKLLGAKKDVPNLIEFADALTNNQNHHGAYSPKEVSKITRKYLKYKLLPQLAGGALAYGGALGLKHLLAKAKHPEEQR